MSVFISFSCSLCSNATSQIFLPDYLCIFLCVIVSIGPTVSKDLSKIVGKQKSLDSLCERFEASLHHSKSSFSKENVDLNVYDRSTLGPTIKTKQ